MGRPGLAVDLVGGTAGAIKPPPSRDPEIKAFWLGIRGFIELRDGQVWAFGGAGFNGGEIARVDVAAPRTLFAFEPPDEVGEEPDPSRPRSPIAHIFEEGGGGLLVFSDNELFRVDRALSSWKKEAAFNVSDRWERAYPPVCVVHPPGRPGGPCLLATIGDGYVLLEGGKATPRGVPGQLGASAIDEIKNTSEGTFFFERSPELPPWRLGAHGWETASLAPFEPDPADGAGFEAGRESWSETRVLVGAGGMIYTVSRGGIGPETLITARRVGGKPERIGREASSLVPWASFLTADGTLWNAYNRKLSRFDEGRWRAVAPLPKGEGAFFLESLNADGPPWLLLGRSGGDLWRLEHGPRGEDPRLARVQLRDGEKALRVRDAIPWHDGALLLATDAGLRAYAPAAGTISRANLPEPARPATVLVRDGLGRLWLGGDDGLWLGEPGAKALEALGRIPGVGRGVVYGLAPDPEHADGVIAALGPRGVAFVRAAPRP